MSTKQNKVAVNLQQDFTETERAQARTNIGAASNASLSSVSNTVQTHESRILALENKEPTLLTVAYSNIGSPSDAPYSLFTYDGLTFTFMANSNACTLRVQSDEVHEISGIVEHISNSTQVADGKNFIKNQSISSTYALYSMSQYEIISSTTELLKIKLWYKKDDVVKSIDMSVFKTGQVDLSFSVIGG